MENGLGLPPGVPQVAGRGQVATSGSDLDALLCLGGGGQVEVSPTAFAEEMTSEIAYVEALHHQDDRIALLVIEPRQQSVAAPLDQSPPRGIRHGVRGVDPVVDDEDVSAAPC